MKENNNENSNNNDGFVRADQIDLKSLDEQLERHLSRLWTMEKNKKKQPDFEDSAAAVRPLSKSPANNRVERQEWEIDPSKLIIKSVLARGTFGTVHRGVYDGMDVAEGDFEQWCIADIQATDAELQAALVYACGEGGADCSKIQENQSCYLKNTLKDHASYAFNSYYQKFKHNGASCYFNGAAITTEEDPSLFK